MFYHHSFSLFYLKSKVNEMGVDKMGVDEMGVNQLKARKVVMLAQLLELRHSKQMFDDELIKERTTHTKTITTQNG